MDKNIIISTLQHETTTSILSAFAIMVGGYFVARLIAALITRVKDGKMKNHTRFVVSRVIYAIVMFIAIMFAFKALGFHVNVLVSLFGIVGISLGFAGQSVISNILAGIFLLGEKRIKIDDIIQVEEVIGQITSLDWLSIKLRTPDQELVRIPNAFIIDRKIVCHTAYPEGSIAIALTLVMNEDFSFDELLAALKQFVQAHDYCDATIPPILDVKYKGDGKLLLYVMVYVYANQYKHANDRLTSHLKNALGAREAMSGKKWERYIFERNLPANQ